MRAKSIWAIQSFLTCFIVNILMVGLFYMMARQVLQGLHQWVDPFLQPGVQNLPEDVRSSLISLKHFLDETRQYLGPVTLGGGGIVTMVLWLMIHLQGRGLAKRLGREAQEAPPVQVSPARGDSEETKRADMQMQGPVVAIEASQQPAIQILSLLQRQGRLIDFLQEDLALYDDAQIGAAVRSIHQGCREALLDHMDLKPIIEETEGARVTIPSDFDPRSIRLMGNVSGNPPFSGILRHRGWRVERVELPQAKLESKRDWVLAPAEVEIEG